MVALRQIARESVPHFGVTRPEDFLGQINQALEGFSEDMLLWKRWADQPLLIGHVEGVLAQMSLNLKEKGDVLETVGYGEMSLWDFYNVLTAKVSHEMPTLNRQMKAWSGLTRASSKW
jgi:hypothetical protein